VHVKFLHFPSFFNQSLLFFGFRELLAHQAAKLPVILVKVYLHDHTEGLTRSPV